MKVIKKNGKLYKKDEPDKGEKDPKQEAKDTLDKGEKKMSISDMKYCPICGHSMASGD